MISLDVAGFMGFAAYWCAVLWLEQLQPALETWSGKAFPKKPFHCPFCVTFWMACVICVACLMLGVGDNRLPLLVVLYLPAVAGCAYGIGTFTGRW